MTPRSFASPACTSRKTRTKRSRNDANLLATGGGQAGLIALNFRYVTHLLDKHSFSVNALSFHSLSIHWNKIFQALQEGMRYNSSYSHVGGSAGFCEMGGRFRNPERLCALSAQLHGQVGILQSESGHYITMLSSWNSGCRVELCGISKMP